MGGAKIAFDFGEQVIELVLFFVACFGQFCYVLEGAISAVKNILLALDIQFPININKARFKAGVYTTYK